MEKLSSQVNPKMSVANFLENWPSAIPFFLQRHMSCVGCSMAVFDTMEEISTTYGLSIEELIADLRSFLNEPLSIEKNSR